MEGKPDENKIALEKMRNVKFETFFACSFETAPDFSLSVSCLFLSPMRQASESDQEVKIKTLQF